LLGDVLGSNHNPIGMTFATNAREKKQVDEKRANDLRNAGADGINRHVNEVAVNEVP
jgi:hypothetical protein